MLLLLYTYLKKSKGVLLRIKFFIVCSALLTMNIMAFAASDEFALYKEVVQKIKEESINPVDEKRLMDGCLDGVINLVDKNGNYYTEEESETLFSPSRLTARTGIKISQQRNHVIVNVVLENSPAAKSGIQKGDEIFKIDGVSLRHMGIDEVIQALRGAPNTKLKLTLLKEGSQKPVEISLVRKVINADLITSRIVNENIAHIKMNSFGPNSLGEILDDMEKLQAGCHGKIKGIVLDLRDNPGGVLNSGLAIASLFLPNDVVIINVQSRQKEDKKQYKNNPADYEGTAYISKIESMKFLKTVPLVVLVNGDSEGSSEIVASALQEYNRATIVGTSTFGKDTFATVFPLVTKQSSMKLATARWTTSKGRSVWPNGVIPHVEVLEEKGKEDVQFEEALHVFNTK